MAAASPARRRPSASRAATTGWRSTRVTWQPSPARARASPPIPAVRSATRGRTPSLMPTALAMDWDLPPPYRRRWRTSPATKSQRTGPMALGPVWRRLRPASSSHSTRGSASARRFSRSPQRGKPRRDARAFASAAKAGAQAMGMREAVEDDRGRGSVGNGHQFDLHPAVGLAALFAVVAGDGVALPVAAGPYPAGGDALGDEQLADAGGAALGEGLVVAVTAGGIGVAHHFHIGLVVFLEHHRHGLEGLVELRAHLVAVDAKGDAAGHIEADVVAIAGHTHAAALELGPQRRLLAIHVVADTAADGAPGQGAGEGTLFAVLAARGGGADDRPGDGADAGALGGVGGFLLAGVGIGGRAAHQGKDGQGCQCLLHCITSVTAGKIQLGLAGPAG